MLDDPDAPEDARDDRSWGADRRDFVADRRDDIADQRERDADQRERDADQRERDADQRESDLLEREQAVGLDPAEVVDLRPDRSRRVTRYPDAAARLAAAELRTEERTDRELAAQQRQEADQRRQAATPATGLALAFAEIASRLSSSGDVDEVLDRVVRVAVDIIAGCDMSSITVREANRLRTVASTADEAIAADEAQYSVDEGPCVDALDETEVHVGSLPDARWPELGSRPADEAGVQSVLSYRLQQEGLGDQVDAGSLNNYGARSDAFDDEAIEIGFVLATHASVALRSAQDRAAGDQLSAALMSRDVIGQAKGILMERLHITPEEAFDLLRRTSQRLNVKLREVAQEVARTGEVEQD